MTSGQWRVLSLLVVLLVLEVLFTPEATDAWNQLRSGKLSAGQFLQDAGSAITGSTTMALGWGVGAIALVAFAAYAPDLATWFVVLLLVLVAVTHPDLFQNTLSTVSGIITTPAGKGK